MQLNGQNENARITKETYARAKKSYPPQVKYNTLYRYIWNQIHKNNGNFVCLILGKPGSGKSYGALSMAYDLQRNQFNEPTFNVWKQLYFSLDELFDGLEAKPERGNVHILDESGIQESLQSRNFMTLDNKLASSLFQTMRFQGQIVFVVAPSGMMIDKQVKITSHADIIFHDHDAEKAWATVKVHDDELWWGNFYRKYPQAVIAGERFKWKAMHFALPPKSLIDSYEWLQTLRKNTMRKKWQQMSRDKKEREQKKKKQKDAMVGFQEGFKLLSDNVDDSFYTKRGKVKVGSVKAFFVRNGKNIADSTAKQLAEALGK